MPNQGPCALQRAYIQLHERGDTDGINALTELVNDLSISTRAAASKAREKLDVILSNNNFTSHRSGNCTACNQLKAAGQDPTRPKPPRANHEAPQFKKTKKTTAKKSAAAASRARARLEHDADGSVQIKDVPLYEPLRLDDNLDPLLTQFGLDPANFEVLRDTFSMWQQSASDRDGGRDVVYLYSAKFRRVSTLDPTMSNAEQLKQWRSVLLKTSKVKKPTYKPNAGTPGTFSMWPTDPQFGKTRTAEAVENYKHGISSAIDDCARLLDAGEPIEGVHIGWGGDEIENIANNYANQAHTIELNLSEQLELDYDMRVWAIKEAMGLGLPISASSVISNHAEFGRNGGKDVETTKTDNASTYVARQVAKLFRELAPHTGIDIDWTIGAAHGGHPGLVVDLSGEKVYASHGHIEKGRGKSTELRTKSAIENQILGDIMAERRLLDVRLYVMAHYHHHYLIEDRGRTVMGLPALEAERSSEFMALQFGVWSPPGMVSMVVGRFDHRPYRHKQVWSQAQPRVDALRPAPSLQHLFKDAA